MNTDAVLKELTAALAVDCQSRPCLDAVHQGDARRVLGVLTTALGVERQRAIDLALRQEPPSGLDRTITNSWLAGYEQARVDIAQAIRSAP